MQQRLANARLRRGPAAIDAARMDIRHFMAGLSQDPYRDQHRNPSLAAVTLVGDEIEAGDLEGAAEDLCQWLSISSGDGAESDHRIATNAKMAINAVKTFLSAPGAPGHPRADEIRQGCLRIAAGAIESLGNPQQADALRLARGEPMEARRPARMSPPAPGDRISTEQLALFGRFEFLGGDLVENMSGIDSTAALDLVSGLTEQIWHSTPGGRADVLAELRRHAANGEWEAVGAWKFVREFMEEAPDTVSLIDGGFSALMRMRVTNLDFVLAPVDKARWWQVNGELPPCVRFYGPPVFDSDFGPSRQYYTDSAVAAEARRTPQRIPDPTGAEPETGSIEPAAGDMWNLGILIHRGPLLASREIAWEAAAARKAIIAARAVDHARLIEEVAAVIFTPGKYLDDAYAPIGAARFAEDYLSPAALLAPSYPRLLDTGLANLLKIEDPGLLAPGLLTPRQEQRLAEIRGR